MVAMTRRHFYVGAAAAFSAARVLGANDRIRVGIVGVGSRGREHLAGFSLIAGSQVVALCDVDRSALERARTTIAKQGGEKAAEFTDMRDMFGRKDIDAVSIAAPNHWHALAAIWACEAGKDVYVEKPASHNIHESYRMVEVARKTGRMVQVGTQRRSTPHRMRAVELLREGIIGTVYAAKGICFKRRASIGRTPVEPVPEGLDWNLFLGPAPMKAYSGNRGRYNWHWFWDTGNGEIGNEGIHEMDICRWALDEAPLPKSVVSTGGKFVYSDEQETPNSQCATFSYGVREILYEVRGLLSGSEAGLPPRDKQRKVVGNIFFGSEGWIAVDAGGFQVYKGEASEKVMDEKVQAAADGSPLRMADDGTTPHITNFLAACRSRNYKELRTDVEAGAKSVNLVHMANISYRVGRLLQWDDEARHFVNDSEANALMTRDYRKPFVV